MKITFPAMKGQMGGRDYYATTMALSEIPRFFRFNDWEAVTPELRAQRVLNESRVPVIAKYITDNENEYLFSSITASYSSGIEFTPASDESPDVGHINMNLEDMEFVINDGQHRCAAIAHALKECPSVGKDRISVLLFPMENLERMQQMFSDLNRFSQRTSKSLNILYDQRDPLATLTMEVVEQVDAFCGMIDSERISIPIRSNKLFTLTSVYDSNKELIGKLTDSIESDEFKKQLDKTVDYWTYLSTIITDWIRIKKGELQAPAIRQEKLNTHAVVLRALGGLGRIAMENYPEDWKRRLMKLDTIDWRKSVGSKVNPFWDGVCITAGSVVSNRQARLATFEALSDAVDIRPFRTEVKKSKAKHKRGRPRKNAAI